MRVQIGTAANSGERFCRDYCGWHSSFRYTPKGGNKTSIKYLWVGLPTRLVREGPLRTHYRGSRHQCGSTSILRG